MTILGSVSGITNALWRHSPPNYDAI